jgi:hypothetical protein
MQDFSNISHLFLVMSFHQAGIQDIEHDEKEDAYDDLADERHLATAFIEHHPTKGAEELYD